MRPWVVSSSKATATGDGITGITIPRPGGVRPGDVLYAFLSRTSITDATNFACDGWTSVFNLNTSTNNDIATCIRRRVATGSEPASFTFANAAGDTVNMTAIIVCVRGADRNTPEDVTITSGNGSNDFTPAATAITPTSGHTLILSMHDASMDSGTSGKTGGAPSGYTLIDYIEEVGATGFESFLEVAQMDQTDPAATTTNVWTGTPDDATSEFHRATIAVRCGTPMLNPASLLPFVISESSRHVTDTLLGDDVITTATTHMFVTDSLLGGDVAIGIQIYQDPIVFAPVDNEVVVPGWNLFGPTPLLFKPIDGDVNVPGWFVLVTDPFDEAMTADVYVLLDLLADPLGTLPIVSLDLETDGRAWDWQDVISDTGAGSITMGNNDSAIGFLDTDDILAVGFNMYGLRVFLLVIELDDIIDYDPNNEIAELTRFSGRGSGVLLELGDVDPTGGPYRSPVEEDRHFGWPAPSFDHASWSEAPIIGTVRDACIQLGIAAVTLLGGGDVFEIIADLFEEVDGRFPIRDTAYVVWAPGTSMTFPTFAPPGECYFYEEFTIPVSGDYLFWIGVDNLGTFYIDGQRVGDVGPGWFAFQSVPVTLSAGTHSVAAVVTNLDAPAGSYNPGKYTWCVTDEIPQAPPSTPALSGYTVFAQTSSACRVLAYPPSVPGQSVTKTIRLAVEESQARGYLTGITLGFTDTTYSDGTPVIVLPDVATKVGTSILGFLGELSETYIDWSLDPVTFVLDVWDLGAQGFVTSAVFGVGDDQGIAGEAEASAANIVSARRRRERRRVSRLLLKWPGGWAERFGAVGGGEAPLELGAAQSLEEVLRIADGQFAIFEDPRTQIDLGLIPEIVPDAPYLGWRKADWVTYRAVLERVVALTVETNSDGPEDPTITVTLRAIILTPEERQARDLRSIL